MAEWVKYSAGFAIMVLSAEVPKFRPEYRHWAIVQNKALQMRLPGMQATYDAVHKHYIDAPNSSPAISESMSTPLPAPSLRSRPPLWPGGQPSSPVSSRVWPPK